MNERRAWSFALALSLATILYNLLEGLVSVYFGHRDETLALFGFGLDSFVEVVSAIGVTVMIMRISRNPGLSRGRFETTALRVTGSGFYLLTAGLVLGSALSAFTGRKPETTFWGVVISLVSILFMLVLVWAKMRVGMRLRSEPIIADAQCGRVCLYMSCVLLVSSLLYEWLHIAYLDSLGALGIAYYAFGEGREAFDKAQGKACACCASEHSSTPLD